MPMSHRVFNSVIKNRIYYHKNGLPSINKININNQSSFYHKHSKENSKNERNNSKLNCLLTVGSFFFGFGFIIYKLKNEIKYYFDDKLFILPIVNAASLFKTTDVSQNREKFNFIADVVEISAPSVVYIEIKDQKR